MIVGDLRRLSSYSLLVHLLHCMIGFIAVEVAQRPAGPGQNFWFKKKKKKKRDEKKKKRKDTEKAWLLGRQVFMCFMCIIFIHC